MNTTKNYYDDKKQNLIKSKDLKRNVHNFLKSVWINRFVQQNDKILDLGCGHGGDFWKIQYRKPLSYWGIDLSNVALMHALSRSHIFPKSVSFKLSCFDFVTSPECICQNTTFDIVLSNFSVHYAFQNEKTAKECIKNIHETLKESGFFIGVIPISSISYSTHTYTQPDDDRLHEEPTVTRETFTTICEELGFKCVEFVNFADMYKNALISESTLAKKMKADKTKPDNFYFAFAFQKLSNN